MEQWIGHVTEIKAVNLSEKAVSIQGTAISVRVNENFCKDFYERVGSKCMYYDDIEIRLGEVLWRGSCDDLKKMLSETIGVKANIS